jgi:hypothetical protein
MPIVKSNNMQNTNEESLPLALFFNALGGDFGFVRSPTYQSQNTKPYEKYEVPKLPSKVIQVIYPRERELVHYAPSVKPVRLLKWV